MNLIKKTMNAFTGAFSSKSTKDERLVMCIQLGWDSDIDELENNIQDLITTLNVRTMSEKSDGTTHKTNTLIKQ